MNKLFIHQNTFRLISPLFSGSLIYVLILLLNNNVIQMEDQFLGEELYFCIGLSMVIQEGVRLILLLLAKRNKLTLFILKIGLQLITSLLFTIFLVSLSLYYYYDLLLGFTPTSSELVEYNIIFATFTIIYITLFLSHQLLNLINTQKITVELEKKESIKEDYVQFIQGINPELLFEGLDALLVQIKLDRKYATESANQSYIDTADEIVDNLAMVYRYTLGKRGKELVTIEEEIEALSQLTTLYEHLPYRHVDINNQTSSKNLILPGILLQLTEALIKSSIRSNQLRMELIIKEENERLVLVSEIYDQIGLKFPYDLVDKINVKYQLYTDRSLTLEEENNWRNVYIPTIPNTQIAN